MDKHRAIIALIHFGGATCCWLLLPSYSIGDELSRPVAIYDADPNHLWNRVHQVLFVRLGPDGNAYGRNRFEPLLWSGTKYLLEESSCKNACAVLEEFIRRKGEGLIENRLKRAIFQRDLWLVFNWLMRDHGGFENPQLQQQQWQRSQKRLGILLGAVIRRVALTRDEITCLPDNYAQAVTSGSFSREFSFEHPDQSYLPRQLFNPDGPWVCVGRPDGPVAREHVREDSSNPFTNSAFVVFLRMPAGRTATIAFLDRLRSFKQPLLVELDKPEHETKQLVPNPQLPQFPVGTETALVRRALLIDSSAHIVPSPITESVQIRVYRDVPAITPETLDIARTASAAANGPAQPWQGVYEFRMDHSLLFANCAGGLRAVAVDERDFKTGFAAHGWDPFETARTDRPFPQAAQQPVRQQCVTCHSYPGVASFNSFFNYRSGSTNTPATLRAVSLSESLNAGRRWKENSPFWNTLRHLLDE